MIGTLVKATMRHLRRDGVHALISIGGLALGMTCAMLIFLYVLYEEGFDRHNHFAESIVRVEEENWATTPIALGPFLRRTFPRVEESARCLHVNRVQVALDDRVFTEKGVYFADSTLFRIFTIPVLAGDPATALTAPNSVVLTRRMAEKYFGSSDPVGRRMRFDTGRPYDLQVTGVVEDPPVQSHFHYDALVSVSTLQLPEDERVQWQISLVYTYLLLAPGADREALARDARSAVLRRVNAPDSTQLTISLRPLTDIHLFAECEKEIEPQGSIRTVVILASVAFLTLGLAIINFINLATARSLRRAKEVAMRKTLGADRARLIIQFLGESMLVSLFAAVFALALTQVSLPFFRDLTGIDPPLAHGFGLLPVVASLVLALIVGIAAGAYPAFVLSRFHPIVVLMPSSRISSPSPRGAFLRKALVVFQFAIAVILIVGSQVITQQLSYLQEKDAGMDADQVVVLPISGIAGDRYATLRSELLALAPVAAVSASFNVPGERIIIEELRAREHPNDPQSLRILLADADFAATYGLRLKEGRAFSRAIASDTSGAFLLNEQAVALLGLEDPLGHALTFQSQHRTGQVVGVVRDFHFASLHTLIEPLAIQFTQNPVFFKYVSVRLGHGDIRKALAGVLAAWRRVLPGPEPEHYFLDEHFRALYSAEMNLRSVVTLFTALGVVIACLGLFSLAAQAVEIRRKEVGIRKVLGARTIGLAFLLTREFLFLVAIACGIAVPCAWWAANRWLDNFAYRSEPGPDVFLVAGALALGIAAVVVGGQTVRAALSNPVNALRYE